MGKKRRNHPTLEALLDRAWCYYCERDFEDLKLLISHQKAKHFKCERCGRRLNTAGGLSVHMNQVHKEALSHVENALPGREGLDVEIFGMEGIPESVLVQHTQQIAEAFHKNRADRQAATGNPQPGVDGRLFGSQRPPHKKLKIETAEELKARLSAYRAEAGARKAAAATAPAAQHQQQHADGALPSRPTNGGFLPQRPSAFGASTLDDLVSGAAAAGGGLPATPGDDIDRVIRMAEAGIKPTTTTVAAVTAPETAAPEKSKKDKASMRMIYADGEFSLEERMAQMPRYAVVV